MKILFNTVIPVPFVTDIMDAMKTQYGVDLVYVFEKKELERRKHWNTTHEGYVLSANKKTRGKEFGDILDKERPDLVIYAHYRSQITNYGIKWCKKQDVPYFIGPHEIIVPINYLNPQKLYRERSILNYIIEELKYIRYKKVTAGAAGVITIGRSSLRKISKVYKGPISNIPYCFNMSHLDDNYCVYQEELIFLYSGQLIWNRNPLLAIDCFCDLRDRNPGQKMKMIVSGKGPLEEQCKDLIKKREAESQIEWITEFKDWYDIHTIYGKAHVLLVLQKFSTWGLIIQEALASSMAVITSCDVESSNDLVLHNYNGFVTTLNKQSILRYMQKYLDDQNLLHNHRARAKEVSRSVDSRELVSELYGFLISNIRVSA